MADLRQWVVVFDLDDTLISERAYQRSGIAAVEQHLADTHDRPMAGVLQHAQQAGVPDVWGYACQLLELPEAAAESLLWVYRLHRPQIALLPGISGLLYGLEQAGVQMAVLSDGRSSSQRLKLEAVSLLHLPLYLSEEWQSSKPHPERYIAIEERWPNRRYATVADNPAKDFLTPNQRGWLSLGAAWVPDPIHPAPRNSISGAASPQAWLSIPEQVQPKFHNSCEPRMAGCDESGHSPISQGIAT
jgi:putative hydrolase of the HAD superfamily